MISRGGCVCGLLRMVERMEERADKMVAVPLWQICGSSIVSG